MGKKRIIQKSEEELLKERERVEEGAKKGLKVSADFKTKNGKIYISSSYNNTIISLADSEGNVLTWASAGSIGFKGAKKSTPFAASKVAETIALTAQKLKIGSVAVFIKGIGSGRESSIRVLASKGLNIISIKDMTPIPHNGCQPPKARRV